MSLKSFLKKKPILRNLLYLVVSFIVLLLLTSLMLRIYTRHGQSYRVPDLKGMTIAEVSKKVKQNNLRYQVYDSLYIAEAVPGTVVTQFPQSGNKVKEDRIIFITISSLEPEKVKVPQIEDVSYREAQGRLIGAGLRVGRIEYRPSEFINLVLSSKINGKSIPPNTFVNKGTAIDLVIGRGLSDEKTIVPDLVGLSAGEAKNMLESMGLSIGALVFDETILTASDSSIAIIWRQRPENATTEYIEIGSSVDVWLTTQLQDPSFNNTLRE